MDDGIMSLIQIQMDKEFPLSILKNSFQNTVKKPKYQMWRKDRRG